MKKILALVVAALLVLSTTAALAADGDPITSVNIPKTIDLNGSLTNVYSPNITYTFTLTPVDPATGATVNDGTTTVGVKRGEVDGATLGNSGNVEFTSAETAVATDITEDLVINFDATKFTTPGVYRYELIDTTTDATLNAAGITRDSSYVDTYYLDVYVNSTGVYGYILSKTNDTEKTTTSTDKVGEIDPDKYYTVDVSLTKTITGTMADVEHEFPFTITLDNNSLSYYGNENTAPTVDNDASATSITVNLKNNEVYYLYGLSPLATVIYQEQNDTAETYTLTITGADSTISAAAQIAAGATKDTGAAHVVSTYEDNTTASVVADSTFSAVTFNNNLDQISPTGVVLRFAPYIAMLAGGALLVLLAIKRRKSDED